jgi:GNAT superfamily N-acetyltransferase
MVTALISNGMECVELSSFDTEVFGHPFYRVHRFDPDGIRAGIAALPTAPKLAVDAKVPASDIRTAQLLMSLGFRTVAMMFHLTHTLETPAPVPLAAEIVPRLELPADVIRLHGQNFCFDRFNLDPLLDHEGAVRLFSRWVGNSLTQGRQQVIHIGSDICTFAMRDDGSVAIDIVSVLRHRMGIGKSLIGGLINESRRLGAQALHVTTECQNVPAWTLYRNAGFQPAGFTAAMHLVRIQNLSESTHS